MRNGDITGDGFDHGTVSYVEQCAEWCEQTDDCCAFEYSHTSKYCQLHMRCDPELNSAQYADYMFCKKSKLLHYIIVTLSKGIDLCIPLSNHEIAVSGGLF